MQAINAQRQIEGQRQTHESVRAVFFHALDTFSEGSGSTRCYWFLEATIAPSRLSDVVVARLPRAFKGHESWYALPIVILLLLWL